MKNSGWRYVASLVVLGLGLLPVLWLVVSAFRPEYEIVSRPYSLPRILTIENFRQLAALPDFSSSVLSSLTAAAVCTVVTMLIVVPSSYLLARYAFPGRDALRWAILSGYLLAPAVVALPYFMLLKASHLLNSTFGIALAHVAVALPLGIVVGALMFSSVPTALEEIAELAGCSFTRRILTVALPLVQFQCFGLAILVFCISWKEFFFAFLIGNSGRTRTLPVLLAALYGGEAVNWHLLCALSTVLIAPVLLVALGAFSLRSTTLVAPGSRG